MSVTDLLLITAPLEEPVLLVEAREHLKEPGTARDAEIMRLIFSARTWGEFYTGRAFITQTWEVVLDAFPLGSDAIYLSPPPLQTVVSVKYRNTINAEITLAPTEYQVDSNESWGRVVLADGKSWPDTYNRIDAVRVRFVCGYGGAGAVPFDVQAAILFHVEAHYDRDERMMEKLIAASEALLYPRRVTRL
jgi:uncharacterized phiE125 gp8 family phage protein